MADVAALVFEIDSSQARSAASDLAKLNDATARAAGGANSLNKTLRDSQGRFKSSYDVARDYGNEVRQLAAKYNPALSAVYQYQQAQLELNRAVALGVLTQKQADASLDAYVASVNSAANATQRAGQMSSFASNNIRNLGFQVNDIAMMSLTGQSLLYLIPQQGLQVVQVMNDIKASGQGLGASLKGAIGQVLNPMALLTLGAVGAGAALIQFGVSFFGATEKAETFDEVLSRISTSISSMQASTKLALSTLEELRVKYGENAEAAREWLRLDLQRQINQSAEDNKAYISDLTEIARAYDGLGPSAIGRIQETQKLSDAFGVTGQKLDHLQKLFRDFASAKTIEQQAKAAEALRDWTDKSGIAADLLPAKYSAALLGLSPLVLKMWELVAATNEAAGASITAGLDDDRGSAIREHRAGVQDARAVRLERTQAAWLDPPKDDKGTAGKAAAELKSAEKGFQSLRELMEKESLFQVAEWEKRQAQLDQALAKKLLSEQTYQEMKSQLQMMYFGTEYEKNAVNYQLDLEQLDALYAAKLLKEEQYQMQLRQLKWDYIAQADSMNSSLLGQELSNWGAHFGQMNSLAGGGYDSLIRLQKSFAAASALINTWKAYTDVLASGEVMSPWAKLAWAGKILAAGMGAVNAIKGGGKGGGSTGASSAARAEPQRNVLVRLEGDEWLVSMAENIMTQIYDASKDGKVIIAGDF